MSFGVNYRGDFDRYALDGVDFGASFQDDYGVEPLSLQGDYTMNGYHQQMGMVPMGMGGYHDQMGAYHHQMGMHLNQMGAFDFNAPIHSSLPAWASYKNLAIAAVVVGGVMYAQRQGMIPKVGMAGF